MQLSDRVRLTYAGGMQEASIHHRSSTFFSTNVKMANVALRAIRW